MKRMTTRLRQALPASALVLTLSASGPAFAQGTPAAPSVTAPNRAAVTGAPVVPGEVVPPAGYVIGPEDVLAIVFWRETDLSVESAVRPDGKITLPLLNDLHAAGLTPEQLRERIHAAATKYLEDPSVTVIVKTINSRKVFITGQIAKPGQYPLTAPTTVIKLIAMAGGLSEFANAKKILIMRTEGGHQIAKRFNYKDVSNGKYLEQNIELQPGDTVIVP